MTAEEELDTRKPEPSSRRRLASGAAWQALATSLPLVINIVLTPYVIRGLGVQLYGIFLLCISAQLLLASIDGGVGAGANRFFALLVGQGKRTEMTNLLGSLIGVVAVFSLSLYAVLYFLAPYVIDFFPAAAPDRSGAILLLRVMLALVAAIQVRALFSQVLYVHHRFRLTSTCLLVGHVVYAVGLVLTIELDAKLTGIALTFAAQMVVQTTILVVAALPYLTLRQFRPVGRADLKQFFGYAWKTQVSQVIDMVTQQSDSLLVAKFAAPALTPFGVGANFAQTLRTLLWSASNPMLALLGRLVGAQGERGAVEEVRDLQRTWVLAVVGWVCVGSPAAYTGVTHWLALGTSLPGVVASVLLVSHGVMLLIMVQNFWVLVLGRPGLALRRGVVNLAINLVATAALIGPFGAVGTITATLVAQLTSSIYFVRSQRSRLTTPLTAPWHEIPWILGLLAATASLVVQLLITGHLGLPSIVPTGPVGLVICGLSSAPVLGLYAVGAVGPRRVGELAGRLVTGGRS